MLKDLTTEKKYILIAEDDLDDQYLLHKAFEPFASCVELITTQNGNEAINHLHLCCEKKTDLPTFIMADLNMPVMDGRELLKSIRNIKQLQHLPVIIFTTSNNPDDIRELYQLGANSYITKPSSMDEIYLNIKVIVDYWFNVSITG